MNHKHLMRSTLAAMVCCLFASFGCAGTDADGRILTPDDAGENPDAQSNQDAGDNNANTDAGMADSANNVDSDTGDSGNANNGGGVCQPNFDGSIARSEVTLRPGLNAKFKVALDAPVDVRGEESNGERTWNFAGDLAGDALELVELRDPDTFWFASSFPNATYVAALSAREDLLGIFQLTEGSLLLLGVASPDDGLFATELEYDPPVEVLAFPIEEGKTWGGEHDVSGLAQGTPVVYTEEYNSEVWSAGTLDIPFGSFDVQSIRVELTRTIGFIETQVRTYAFVSECFGTVATVTSQDDEDEIYFTEAAEIRRLAP